jgi:UDP:flavonoid glycosyltransferase YjiC (YdhE family)
VPVLVCPAIGDMAETGARAAWAGVGLMLPGRLVGPGPLRWATRRLLTDASFARRAALVGATATEGPGEGATLVENLP